MKKFTIILITIGLIVSCSISRNNLQNNNHSITNQSLELNNYQIYESEEIRGESRDLHKTMRLITSFFDDIYKYNAIHRLEIQQLAVEVLTHCRYDSIYFFQYNSPINGLNVKGYLYNVKNSHRESYIGDAVLFTLKDSLWHYFQHPMFEIKDSIFLTFKENQINTLDYKLIKDAYYKDNQLGSLHGVPFGFFDIDFDNKKDLLLRLPFIGQRWRSVYISLVLPEEDSFKYEENYFTAELDSIRFNSEEYGNYLSLDDQTIFDSKNKMMIIDVSGGVGNSMKEYYKIKKGENPKLIRIENY